MIEFRMTLSIALAAVFLLGCSKDNNGSNNKVPAAREIKIVPDPEATYFLVRRIADPAVESKWVYHRVAPESGSAQVAAWTSAHHDELVAAKEAPPLAMMPGNGMWCVHPDGTLDYYPLYSKRVADDHIGKPKMPGQYESIIDSGALAALYALFEEYGEVVTRDQLPAGVRNWE